MKSINKRQQTVDIADGDGEVIQYAARIVQIDRLVIERGTDPDHIKVSLDLVLRPTGTHIPVSGDVWDTTKFINALLDLASAETLDAVVGRRLLLLFADATTAVPAGFAGVYHDECYMLDDLFETTERAG